jgi:hypothetical protein
MTMMLAQSVDKIRLMLCQSITSRPRSFFWSYFSNKYVLSLTHMLILNLCLTTSMHGLYTSTQHLDKTLEPLNWIRVCPSFCDKHSGKRSEVLYYVSCNISKYMTFKPDTPRIHIPSNCSHLNILVDL